MINISCYYYVSGVRKDTELRIPYAFNSFMSLNSLLGGGLGYPFQLSTVFF